MHATPKLTVVILSGTLLVAGCARGEPVNAVAQPAVSASIPMAAEPTATPIDPAHPRRGPTKAAIGTPYSFDLYTHCGGEYTRFAGRTWRTDDPPGNLLPRADAAGVTRITGYVYGTMTLVELDRAQFVIDPAGVADPPEGPVVFHPSDTPAPLCK
nr:hypothetical protein GCM10020092_034630 [Actinoplanes digitatis]